MDRSLVSRIADVFDLAVPLHLDGDRNFVLPYGEGEFFFEWDADAGSWAAGVQDRGRVRHHGSEREAAESLLADWSMTSTELAFGGRGRCFEVEFPLDHRALEAGWVFGATDAWDYWLVPLDLSARGRAPGVWPRPGGHILRTVEPHMVVRYGKVSTWFDPRGGAAILLDYSLKTPLVLARGSDVAVHSACRLTAS